MAVERSRPFRPSAPLAQGGWQDFIALDEIAEPVPDGALTELNAVLSLQRPADLGTAPQRMAPADAEDGLPGLSIPLPPAHSPRPAAFEFQTPRPGLIHARQPAAASRSFQARRFKGGGFAAAFAAQLLVQAQLSPALPGVSGKFGSGFAGTVKSWCK